METREIALDYLHNDHKRWMDEIEFCRQEVQFFEHRLEEIVTRAEDTEAKASIEHFQNQFIREKEVMDELMHEVKLQEQNLAKQAQNGEYREEDYQMKQHVALGDKMIRFSELYNDLKKSFNRFLVKWMEKRID